MKRSRFSEEQIGEIASLIIGDVVQGDGTVREELRLKPSQTKGGVARTVFVNKRLQRDIRRYLDSFPAL